MTHRESDAAKRTVTERIKMTEYRIVQVDWENANNAICMVLLSKAERQSLNCEEHSGVYCKHGYDKRIALVSKQFRQYVGQERVATINKKLADEIHAAVGDIIEIDAGVTESEWAVFERTIPRMLPMRDLFIAAMGAPQRDAETVGGHE